MWSNICGHIYLSSLRQAVCHVPGHTARAETPISSISTPMYLFYCHSASVSSSIALWCITPICQTATTPHPYQLEERTKYCLKCMWYRSLRGRWKKCSAKNAVVAPWSHLLLGSGAADMWVSCGVWLLLQPRLFQNQELSHCFSQRFLRRHKGFFHAIVKNLSCYNL